MFQFYFPWLALLFPLPLFVRWLIPLKEHKDQVPEIYFPACHRLKAAFSQDHRAKVKKKCLDFINSSLISLAVGSLFGDAVIHIMPEIYATVLREENSTQPVKNNVIVSLMVVIGFLTFFIIEKIFLFTGLGHSHGTDTDHYQEHDLADDHSHHNDDIEAKSKYNF